METSARANKSYPPGEQVRGYYFREERGGIEGFGRRPRLRLHLQWRGRRSKIEIRKKEKKKAAGSEKVPATNSHSSAARILRASIFRPDGFIRGQVFRPIFLNLVTRLRDATIKTMADDRVDGGGRRQADRGNEINLSGVEFATDRVPWKFRMSSPYSTIIHELSRIKRNSTWIVKNYFFNNPFLRHSSIQKPRLDKWNFAEDLSRSWRRIENRGRDNATIRSVSGKGKKWKLLRTCSRECRYIKPRFSRIRKETGGNFETSWIFVLENETMEEIEKSGY